MPDDSMLAGLRTALNATPGNQPLRRLLAKALLDHLRYDEAEAEFRLAIEANSNDRDAQMGLAQAFAGQGKHSAALAICETLSTDGATPALLMLHARLLAEPQPRKARQLYDQARAMDPNLTDAGLERLPPAARPEGTSRDASARDDDPREESPPPRLRNDGSVSQENEAYQPDIERPTLSFDQVGGMNSVKDEIRMRIIHPLTNKDLYAAYGKKAGGGILLYGPPGCGKTLLARATAGEVKVKFIAVGINDILDMWIGSSERNLHGVFASARSNRPCVLFFDEVDALAASRRDLRQSAGRQVINQFLSELDGVDGNNEDVLVMAATNAPWHLDSAFRRPGRFDRIIFVPPPDQPARAAILSVLLKGKPAAEVDVSAVAKKTPDFSGADLQAVVERAVEEKLTEAMKSNRLEPLTTKSMLAAASRVKPSTKEWFTTARNHALYANENGLYDPILEYMNIK